jgi:Protein of unknown function (DUF2934)
MATTTKKPSAAPIAAVAPAATKTAAKKAVATQTAAAKKVVAPVAAPVTTPEVVAKKASATATKLKPSTAPAPVLTVEQRNHYVSVAAFYIAERRGFTLGNPADDWMAAEAEVDRLIASGHFTA